MAVTFNSGNGAGYSGTGTTITLASTAGDYIIAVVSFDRSTTVSSVTHAGASMTLLASDTTQQLYVYGRANSPGGTNNIIIANAWSVSLLNAFPFSGVGSVGTPIKASSTAGGSISSGPVTCPPQGMLAAFLGHGGNFTNGPLSSVTGGTVRSNATNGGSIAAITAVADTTFTATVGNSQLAAAIVIPLLPPATAKEGSASGSYSWSSSSAGRKPVKGIGSAAFSWVGEASGATAKFGSASGTHSWKGGAFSATSRRGVAAGAISWSGSAAGRRSPVGSVSGTYGWSSSTHGVTVRYGSASAQLSWAGSALGAMTKGGTASGTYRYTGSAKGLLTLMPPPWRVYTPDHQVRIHTPDPSTRIFTPT